MRILLMCFWLLSVLAMHGQEVVLRDLPEESGRKIHESEHFRIELEITLKPENLLRLARIIEATVKAVKELPLPFYSPGKQRASLIVFAQGTDYEAAGAPEFSAGFYDAKTSRILIRGSSLLGQNLFAEELLIHEVVHHCTQEVNGKSPQWLVEGIAEYLCSAHQGGGRFSFAEPERNIREYLGRRMMVRNPVVTATRLTEVISLDHSGWDSLLKDLPENQRYQPYVSALLLTHYHLHGGKERSDVMRKFLEIKPTKDRRRSMKDQWPTVDAKLVEPSLLRYWKGKGLQLVFQTNQSPASSGRSSKDADR